MFVIVITRRQWRSVAPGQGCVLTGERPHSGSESVGTLRDPG